MRSALYYPHTEIKSAALLKTSLLLWDRLEFIVPDPAYKPYYEDSDFAEAIELIGVQRYPSNQEKRQAHDLIEEFATRKLPDAFYYQSADGGSRDYEIYPQKLLHETWRLLQQAQFTSNPLPNADYPLTQSAGLSIMSLLADCCAGETRARVTDRGLAYATVTNLLVEDQPPHQANYDIVVPLTLSLINTSELPLKTLVAFRKKEEASSGPELRDLRHRYIQRIESHIKAVRSLKKSEDRAELERQFQEDMADDLQHLRNELRVAKQDAWFSKDIIITAIAGVGAAAALIYGAPLSVPAAFTVAGLPVTIGGILGTRNKFATTRKAVMQKHPMAYMYELQQFA